MLEYNHAITVQILTFRLVTLKVAHQFDVLVNVFEAFQFPTVVNELHGVLQSLGGEKTTETCSGPPAQQTLVEKKYLFYLK